MDDRSAQLYRAAAELFVERGYRDVDVVDITGRCGVSPGTFYNYFRNKRDVLELILGKGIDGLVQAAAAGGDATTITGRGAFFAELEARMRAILQYIADNADVMAFVAFTAPGLDDAAYRSALNGYWELSAQFTALLSTGRRRGWIRQDVDLQIAGQVVVSCLVTAALPVLLGEVVDEFDAAEVAATCCTYLLGGMRSLLPG